MRLVPPLAAVLAVLVVAGATHTWNALDLVAALVLAPLACLAAGAAGRAAGGARIGLAAECVYVLLPLLGAVYVLGSFRHSFTHVGAPELVGLHEPWRLAVGTAATAVLALTPETAAAAIGAVAFVAALAAWQGTGLDDVHGGLHETGWSTTLAEWVVVAGIVGAATRSWRRAIGFGGWTVAAVLAAAHGGYDARFWGELAIAAPAIAALLTSIALLVPRLRPARRPAAPDAG